MNSKKTIIYDAIIIGAGGAGLMCAASAGQRDKKVLLLDHADEVGKKILISGGGRCNFTNHEVSAKNYLSQNPHFAKSALARYKPKDFIDLINRYKIAWHEKMLGQLFCDDSAKQVVAMLLAECKLGGVDVHTSETITNVTKNDQHFEVVTNLANYITDKLVLATGGLSIPKMGATGFAYEIAKQFKLKLIETRPALVPLKLDEHETLFKSLSGVSTNVKAKHGKTTFEEAALFTHKGLSGPAILQISSYWRHRETIEIDFLPALKADWLLDLKQSNPRFNLIKTLSTHLPERLSEALLTRLVSPENLKKELGNTADKELNRLTEALANWQFKPNGTEGYAKAEVTIGGVSTDELSSKTMEAKKVAGLYVIGEAVDVTGWLGGYNFQWAWASGWVAGQSI